jgi:PilZ domain-containing protein
MGGLFIETPKPKPTDAVTKLNFLVEEGQIRAEAVVRHAKANSGLGLKFVAITEDDRPRLAALVTRLRNLSRSNR